MGRFRLSVIILLAAALLFWGGSKLYSRIYVDSLPPVITCDTDTLEASVQDGSEALLKGVVASDARDGDVTGDVIVAGISKLISNNTAKVTYIVFDEANNMGTLTRYVRYTDYTRPWFELDRPLTYAEGEAISLTGRLRAMDVIDGDITGSITVSTLDLSAATRGVYSITVRATNSLGDTARVSLPVIIHAADMAVPDVMLKSYIVYIEKGSAFDPASHIKTVFDMQYRTATAQDVSIEGEVNTAEPGEYRVLYTYVSPVTGLTGTSALVAVVQ